MLALCTISKPFAGRYLLKQCTVQQNTVIRSMLWAYKLCSRACKVVLTTASLPSQIFLIAIHLYTAVGLTSSIRFSIGVLQ